MFEVPQPQVALDVPLVQLCQLVLEKEAEGFFGFAFYLDLFVLPDQFIGQFLLHFFQLSFAFDQSVDVLDQVLLGLFEIGVFRAQAFVDVGEMPPCVSTHNCYI